MGVQATVALGSKYRAAVEVRFFVFWSGLASGWRSLPSETMFVVVSSEPIGFSTNRFIKVRIDGGIDHGLEGLVWDRSFGNGDFSLLGEDQRHDSAVIEDV